MRDLRLCCENNPDFEKSLPHGMDVKIKSPHKGVTEFKSAVM